MELPYDPAIPLLGIYLKKPETLILKNICTPVSIIYNSQDLEVAPMPTVDEWKKSCYIYTLE